MKRVIDIITVCFFLIVVSCNSIDKRSNDNKIFIAYYREKNKGISSRIMLNKNCYKLSESIIINVFIDNTSDQYYYTHIFGKSGGIYADLPFFYLIDSDKRIMELTFYNANFSEWVLSKPAEWSKSKSFTEYPPHSSSLVLSGDLLELINNYNELGMNPDFMSDFYNGGEYSLILRCYGLSNEVTFRIIDSTSDQ